jgi:very-short-patch-repair endonuclease
VVFEYEGEDHWRDRRQWARDQQRRELFEEAGWKVIRVFDVDLFLRPADFIRRVVAVLNARGPQS